MSEQVVAGINLEDALMLSPHDASKYAGKLFDASVLKEIEEQEDRESVLKRIRCRIRYLKSLTPERLQAIAAPPEPFKSCPRCGMNAEVSIYFGWRMLGGKKKPQSYCRKCRKNPSRACRPGRTLEQP
jgi:hypothetical protein